MEGELSRLHGVGVAKHQKGIQASFLPAKDVYAAEFLPVTFKAVLEMLDPLAETRANLVELRDDVNALSRVRGAIGRRRHRREKRRADPVGQLKHRMVLTVAENRRGNAFA